MALYLRTSAGTVEHRMPAPPGSAWGDSTPPTNGMLGSPVAGVSVTEKNVLGIAAVYSCIGILADSLATLPLRQYKGSPLKKKNAREIAPSPLIENPWPDAGMTLVDFLTGGQVSLGLRGNCFGQIVDRDKNLNATMIQPFDPDHVRVKRNAAGEPEYRVGGKIIPSDDVFHVRNIVRSGNLLGLNPIEELRSTFGLARAQELYAGSFFSNSALPNGVLETEEDLTEEQTLALARAWMGTHQGIGQANLPAVLTGGVTWKETQIAPVDAQFIESRQLSVTEIAMLFRIPPHMISAVDRTTSWGTGIEQQARGFVQITLGGYLRRWEASLTALLPPGQFVKFDLRELLRGDTLQRFQSYTLARNGGWMSANDILAAEDQPGIGAAGDIYLQPANFGPLGNPNPQADGVPNPMATDSGAQKSPTS